MKSTAELESAQLQADMLMLNEQELAVKVQMAKSLKALAEKPTEQQQQPSTRKTKITVNRNDSGFIVSLDVETVVGGA